MSKNYMQKISSIFQMLENLDRDLNLSSFNETEKKIYYTIANQIHKNGRCNISNVINASGYSRSTVYKAIKAFENKEMVALIQSESDKREFYISLAI
ncbi:winged helix-turn-helix transcriptional regulator [Gammaproteobacteria bacterium]|jgi:DNA-binding MarR family transcriptional regulator|nr:winged helix-turn-helix transcriptional regulator [Gammaproteobacteria bacterium]